MNNPGETFEFSRLPAGRTYGPHHYQRIKICLLFISEIDIPNNTSMVMSLVHWIQQVTRHI
ncbi:hypothetical protein HA49_15295 [Tatumella morbirosei]|uniref:Uncharacterized protein n=1 Tax=Tatumella morbirosei TaxID=642227 RepID=A0A095T654_9GAMM|nr:hypothetical protein HA49_15295 [Tatumella morbirosei]